MSFRDFDLRDEFLGLAWSGIRPRSPDAGVRPEKRRFFSTDCPADSQGPQTDALQTYVLNLHAAWAPESLFGTCHRLLPVDCSHPPDRIACLQWSSLNTVFSGNAAGHFLRNWTNGRRHDQAADGQGLRVYRHRKRQGLVFSFVNRRRSELRRTPRRTASVIHRRAWTERAMCRKRQAGLTELRGTFVFNHPEAYIRLVDVEKARPRAISELLS
ncbi:hypothetical protein LCGC14_3082130 [marine sediment metagenome]|uniref:Uncharacterized protein n=1 Tax=marine sediment metagenome TaxID=412755 RepID=A0A0F8WCW8_9ZZZZ